MHFLRRPFPYSQESLSSYLHRLALENYCEDSWILKELGIKSLYSLFIDLTKNQNKILNISELISLDTKDIYNMTLHYFRIDRLSLSWAFRSVPMIQARTKPKRFPYRYFLKNPLFCPLCLKEQKYTRLYWYINVIKICAFHETKLFGHCDICGRTIRAENHVSALCECGRKLDNIGCEWNSDSYYRFLAIDKPIYEELGII